MMTFLFLVNQGLAMGNAGVGVNWNPIRVAPTPTVSLSAPPPGLTVEWSKIAFEAVVVWTSVTVEPA